MPRIKQYPLSTGVPWVDAILEVMSHDTSAGLSPTPMTGGVLSSAVKQIAAREPNLFRALLHLPAETPLQETGLAEVVDTATPVGKILGLVKRWSQAGMKGQPKKVYRAVEKTGEEQLSDVSTSIYPETAQHFSWQGRPVRAFELPPKGVLLDIGRLNAIRPSFVDPMTKGEIVALRESLKALER